MPQDSDSKKRSSSRIPEKKTDRAPWERRKKASVDKQLGKSNQLLGRVLAITPEAISVQEIKKTSIESSGSIYSCTLRGLLKKEKGRHTRLIVIGDHVLFERQNNDSGTITTILERTSLLSRSDSTGKREKLIAANIDVALITATMSHPPLQVHLLDRYIIAAKKGGLEPAIVINKVDLIKKRSTEEKILDDIEKIYTPLGIQVIQVSAKSGRNMNLLQEVMANKTSVFVGESGVGKSSLINSITGSNLPTSEISHKTLKGVHTTTWAELIILSFGGWCVDTPGIQTLGFWSLTIEDLKENFPDLTRFARDCHYPDCTHTHEPDCAVLNALEKKEILPLRYDSYLKLLKCTSN